MNWAVIESSFSVSDAWQSPAGFNIIPVLIFVVPFLFQCLSNDHLALAFKYKWYIQLYTQVAV